MKGWISRLSSLTQAAGVPVRFSGDLPDLRISAMRSLVVEPHCGIRSFSDDSVLIETGDGLVHIRGKAMVIKRMTEKELHLQGQFHAVELVQQDAI